MPTRRHVIAAGGALAAAAAIGAGLWPRMGPYRAAVAAQRALSASGEPLVDLVRLATLAANGHNTQPWTFRLEGDRMSIRPDFARRTAAVDPDDHHLFVSLGCAAENIAVAAPAFGRAAGVAIRGDGDTRIDIAFAPAATAETALYRAIPERQSTRAPFDGQPLSAGDLRLLEAAAREEGVAVLLFTTQAQREAILDFVIAGNDAQMDDPAFVAELRHWLRFTPEQALATGDGLFAAASGNPVAPAWLAARLFGLFFTKDAETAKYRDQIRSSAGVAAFVGDRDDPEHWIRVGRSFQRFALQATALGIRTAHINQPVEVAAVRARFAAWLGAPGRRPDLVIRFGRGPMLPMSLRRPAEAAIVRG